jgi:hypothetical protein
MQPILEVSGRPQGLERFSKFPRESLR